MTPLLVHCANDHCPNPVDSLNRLCSECTRRSLEWLGTQIVPDVTAVCDPPVTVRGEEFVIRESFWIGNRVLRQKLVPVVCVEKRTAPPKELLTEPRQGSPDKL